MKRVLIITYYWPPSSGSGVQRWMYFCKYLNEFGINPIVVTVDDKKASYRFRDESFIEQVKNVETHRTKTFEPLRFYSKITSGNERVGIPVGFAGESNPTLFQKLSRAIRGNFFIPDARIGWVKFATKKAKEIIKNENIDLVITTGPPHSTHLVGLKLKRKFQITWVPDFRDPWTDLHYNKFLYRTRYAKRKDARLEKRVLEQADLVLTVGPSMKKHLVKKGRIDHSKAHYIYNGYDEDDFKDIDLIQHKGQFVISHVGILSDTQPITSFLAALQHFFKEGHPICKNLVLQLIGNVSQKSIEEVKNILPQLNFEHIEYVPKKAAISHMISSDLLFNSLAEMENSELLISGKLMEYIATGKPILCLGNPNGDAAYLLKDYPDCAVFDRKSVDSIIRYLEQLFNNWVNKVTFERQERNYSQYSRYETTKQLSDLLNKYL